MRPTLGPRGWPRWGRRLLIPGVLALALTGVASLSAYTTLGKPFPGFLVDAYHFYSLVELPFWPTARHPGVRDYVVEVAGQPVPPRAAELPPLAFYEQAPKDTLLKFEGPQGESVALTVSVAGRLGAAEFVLLFVTYLLAAWMVLWSGGLVLAWGDRPAAQRAYAFWAVVTFLFLLSFYDYHTRAWLAPLFSVSTLGIPLAALWLAYAFPRPPRWGAVVLRRALITLTLLGAVTALGLAGARFTGWNIGPLRQAIDLLMAPSIATLAVAVLLRLRHSTGLERAELVTASWGLITTPVLIALIQLVTLHRDQDVRHLVLPFVVLLFPLSLGFAMIRNNILEARVVLTPRMLMVPVVLGSLLVAVLGTSATQLAAEGGQRERTVRVLLGCVLFVLTVLLARRFLLRFFFPATLAFRATVEDLSDRLATLRDLEAIQRAVEEVVARAIPTLSAQVLEPGALDAHPHLPLDARTRLTRGDTVWTAQSPREQRLLLPMRSLGELRAVLRVAPKQEAALYTQEDLYLLETLCGLAALALHNAEVVQELESIRRLEVGAAHTEKQLTLSALSEELCHEMVYPLNFLQDLLRRGGNGQLLDEEDLFFAREEIDRMKRMLDSLRRLQSPTPRVVPLQLIDHVQRALALLHEPIQDKQLHVEVEIPPEWTVMAESDSLVQLLSNLLRNAVQATSERGALGIRAYQGPEHAFIEVWDTGPGIPEAVARVLFTSRRISTKKGGYGIGLTVVQRIAYSFRWDISFHREADRTLFRLTLPPPPGSPTP
jgi:two-component system, OmpR family, sensor histidine kinase KdpD